MTKSTRLCSDLKEGEKFQIAGINMIFSYFVANRHPLFTHEINGQTYGYYRTSWNKSTPVNQIK